MALIPYVKNNRLYACRPFSRIPPLVTPPPPTDPTPESEANFMGNGVVLGRSIAVIPNPAESSTSRRRCERQVLLDAAQGERRDFYHLAYSGRRISGGAGLLVAPPEWWESPVGGRPRQVPEGVIAAGQGVGLAEADGTPSNDDWTRTPRRPTRVF